VILLSTSRVYGIELLRSLPYTVEESRFDWRTSRISNVHGFDPQRGISESFSTDGFRSIYGTTKLASELMLTEYHHNYGIQILILRCGLVAGPGQMARSDQGIVTLWVARHLFGQSIKYIGFDGSGRQVRDVMHVEDLVEFVMQRLAEPEHWQAKTYNLGGGMSVSVSLCELSELCRRITGQSIPIESDVKTSMVDIPIYISDTSLAASTFQWQPKRTVEHVVEDISHWILQGDANLWRILGKNA
jgi:CDP-paratose 2-epimerase